MSLNVLVVDDSAVMRGMIIKTLHLCGLDIGTVFQAANGAEALEVLDEQWVDVALVDIHMPVMNGEQFIDNVRQREDIADLPVIVVSSESSRNKIEIIRGKADEFIHKPFTPETVREVVASITGVSDARSAQPETTCNNGFDF